MLGHFYEFAQSAIDPLIQLFFDADQKVREGAGGAVMRILGSMNDEAKIGLIVERLLQHLNSQNPGVRAAAAYALTDVPDRCLSALPLLLRRLEDPDPLVQKNIAILLSRFVIREVRDSDDPRIITKLLQRLEDENLEVRKVVAAQLISIAAYSFLLQQLLGRKKISPSVIPIFAAFPKLLRFFPEDPHPDLTRDGLRISVKENDAHKLKEFFLYSLVELQNNAEVIANLAKELTPLLEDKNPQLRKMAGYYLAIIAPFLKKPEYDKGTPVDPSRLGAALVIDQRGKETGGGLGLSGQYSLTPRLTLRGSVKGIVTPYFRTDLSVGPIFDLNYLISDSPVFPRFTFLEAGVFHYWKEKTTGLAFLPVGAGLRWNLGKNLAAEGGAKLAVDVPFKGPVKWGMEGKIGIALNF